MSLPKIGNNAPAFSLLDQNEKTISLKDFKDKSNVIIYFYPKAMTPGCTTQACGLRDSKAELKKVNAVALGISPDMPVRLLKFADRDKLNFTLLSDPDNAVTLKYGCFGPKKFMGREYDGVHRMTFIVGMDGKLKHIFEKVNTKTHHDDVINWIKNNL